VDLALDKVNPSSLRPYAEFEQSLLKPGLVKRISRGGILSYWLSSTEVGRRANVPGKGMALGRVVNEKAHRDQGVVPHTSIDTEAAWSKSGWHGW
jgi:hypothetical protein